MMPLAKITRLLLSLSIFLVFFSTLKGQTSATSSSDTDEKEIEAVILGYITNFFLNDTTKMEPFLHQRLSKRGVNQDGQLSPDYPVPTLKKLMANKRALPLDRQENKVFDIEVKNRVATAVLATGYPGLRWKEYMNLAKLDGKWIIMDVLWCFDEIKD